MARKKATKKSKPLTSGEIGERLATKYRGEEWSIFFEVRNSTGYGIQERYADAIAMGMYPSKGLKVHGFEFKSARTDLVRELESVAKSAAIQKYCDHWWLVLGREDLIKAGELPSTWGLMVPDGDGLRAVVPAPELKPCALDRRFLASILRCSKRAIAAGGSEAREKKAWDKGWSDGLVSKKSDRDYELQSKERKLQQLKKSVKIFQEASDIDIAREWDLGAIGAAARLIVNSGVDKVNRDLEAYLRGVRRSLEYCEKKALELREDGMAKIVKP